MSHTKKKISICDWGAGKGRDLVEAWQQPRGFAFRSAVTLGLAILMMGTMVQHAFPAGEPAKLRVLIFSGLNNHDWRSTTPVIKKNELYHQMVQMAEQPLQVVFKALTAREQAGTGRHEPVLVRTELGRGRGVNLVLGHDAAAMGAGSRTLLLRGAEWAATGQVTLPPPSLQPSTPAAMTDAGINLDATLSAVARYQYGDERKPLHALQELVRYAGNLAGDDPQGFRGELADRMVALLASPDATPAAKSFVCGQLADIATEKQAAAVYGLLANRQLAADAALRALERIPGPAVDRMLRDALGTLAGDLKAGNRDAAIAARAFKVLKDILKPVNLALGATATSPDGLDPDGASGGDKAAIDGDPNTYWDEVDNADLYRLKVTFKEPQDVSSINILWHPYEQHQAKNLDVLCDGKVVAEVRQAKSFENEMFIAFPSIRCTSVELVIPGKNGLVSPAIHEFQIFEKEWQAFASRE